MLLSKGSFILTVHVMLLVSFITTIALLKTANKMISKLVHNIIIILNFLFAKSTKTL